MNIFPLVGDCNSNGQMRARSDTVGSNDAVRHTRKRFQPQQRYASDEVQIRELNSSPASAVQRAQDGQPTLTTMSDIPGLTDVKQSGMGNPKSTYFEDGKRLIDFVLVYVTNQPRSSRVNEVERQRSYFEENLKKEGLELEEDVHSHQGGETSSHTSTVFLKVHAPWNVLCRQAEILKLKQPTRLIDTDPDGDSDQSECITWPFSSKYIELFTLDKKNEFFWPSRRHEIVWEVMQKTRNDSNDEKRRGIESLLQKGIYESAYPLHDGSCEKDNDDDDQNCERQLLKCTWASWKCLFKRQPIHLIRRYYGEKVGFYFAFLGFYTKLLLFPSAVGVLTFLYGMFYAGDDVILEDICDPDREPGNYTMCPLCQPPYCRFTKLYEACLNAKWDYRLDNEATLVMAALIVIWATVMEKLWKRRQADLAFQWDTHDVKIEDAVIRPDFEARAPAKRRNAVTKELEPHVPKCNKLLWTAASTCVTLLMLTAVGAALTVLVIARVRLYRVFHAMGFHDNVELARWSVHGLIFIVVVVFEKTYSLLARNLTSFECPKTQQEWLASFLWKVFIFALLNDFVPIGYAAWVKGRLTNTPLDLSWHTELCDSGGCMSEVTELISILLLCRLVIGNLSELCLPLIKNSWTRFHEKFKFRAFFSRFFGSVLKTPSKKSTKRGVLRRHDARWHQDFLLGELEDDAVSPEYLEMIVQFAFVTLFIPSMPLAPLVCLVNNAIEIRVDAVKFLTAHRRPLPVRAPGSLIWNDFLNVIGKLAIVSNAGLISFTSNVLPRLYYKYGKNGGHSYTGFIHASLSQLHYTHFDGDEDRLRAFFEHNVTICYYEDYRDTDYPFKRSALWWEIQCIRMTAFALFLVLSFSFQWLFNLIVPDTPEKVSMKIQRRRYIVNKALEVATNGKADTRNGLLSNRRRSRRVM